jgi:hypothetical protein
VTLQQNYDVAYAKANAAADCAACVRMTLVLTQGVPVDVNNGDAYRDEVRAICDDLTQRAVDLDLDAQIIRPGFTPDLP